jgi:hypothetical protein
VDLLPQSAEAEEMLSTQRSLYRGAIGASGHQAILDTRPLSQLSDENHPGDRQGEDDDQPDQRRRPALIGSVIAMLGSITHWLAGEVAASKPPDNSPARAR